VTTMRSFKTQLWQEVDRAFWFFFNNIKPVNFFHAVRLNIARLAYRLLGHQYLLIWARKNAQLQTALEYFDVDSLDELASWLGDDYSRQMLSKLMGRKLFQGLTKPEPMIDTEKDNAAIERVKDLIKTPNTYSRTGTTSYVLNFYDLSRIGYELCLHMYQATVKCTFIYEQYRYKHNSLDIGIEKGDIAIDGGGCWADTALYMAAKGAESVYSFEFTKENIEVFNQNLAANPEWAKQITLVKKALWDKDGVQLQFTSDGPGTSVANPQALTSPDQQVETITIDTFVEQMKIERVDFIKMDIEGAELNALEGSKNTIKRFAPKLAICVYHKPEDLFTIPQFIKSLRPDYTLYLDHFTTSMFETVLFAVPRKS
jgi:FkbM family methyltransferase